MKRHALRVAAIALCCARKSPRILVSGDHGTGSYDEVNAMRRYLEGHGVPAEHIFMDHAGFTTYDTLYRAREVFGVRRAVVVTQRFHLTRSLFVADALGIDAEGVVADRRPYTLASLVRSNVREVGARVKAAVQSLATPLPRYLGPRIPRGMVGSTSGSVLNTRSRGRWTTPRVCSDDFGFGSIDVNDDAIVDVVIRPCVAAETSEPDRYPSTVSLGDAALGDFGVAQPLPGCDVLNIPPARVRAVGVDDLNCDGVTDVIASSGTSRFVLLGGPGGLSAARCAAAPATP